MEENTEVEEEKVENGEEEQEKVQNADLGKEEKGGECRGGEKGK